MHDAARLRVQIAGSNAKDLAQANSGRLHASCMQACSMMMAVHCNASKLLQRFRQHVATVCALIKCDLVPLHEALHRVSSLNSTGKEGFQEFADFAETVDVLIHENFFTYRDAMWEILY